MKGQISIKGIIITLIVIFAGVGIYTGSVWFTSTQEDAFIKQMINDSINVAVYSNVNDLTRYDVYKLSEPCGFIKVRYEDDVMKIYCGKTEVYTAYVSTAHVKNSVLNTIVNNKKNKNIEMKFINNTYDCSYSYWDENVTGENLTVQKTCTEEDKVELIRSVDYNKGSSKSEYYASVDDVLIVTSDKIKLNFQMKSGSPVKSVIKLCFSKFIDDKIKFDGIEEYKSQKESNGQLCYYYGNKEGDYIVDPAWTDSSHTYGGKAFYLPYAVNRTSNYYGGVLGQGNSTLNSIYFDGSNDYMTVDDTGDIFDFGSGNFTIEFFDNRTDATVGGVFSRNAYADYTPFTFVNSNNNETFYASSNGVSWDCVSAMQLGPVTYGQYVYFVLTRNGTTISAYRNGVFISSTTCNSGIQDVSAPFAIGEYGAGNYYYKGNLDSIRIYKGRALNSSEIVSRNASGRNLTITNDNGLVYYNYMDGLTDLSNSENGLSAYGGITITNSNSYSNDGSAKYLEIQQTNMKTENITNCMWIQKNIANNYPAAGTMANLYGMFGNSQTYEFGFTSGNKDKLTLQKQSSGGDYGTFTSTETITDTNWHFICVWQKGNSAKLWIDGINVSYSISGNAGTLAEVTTNVKPKYFYSSRYEYFNGNMSGMTQWNYSLNNSEILFLNSSGRNYTFEVYPSPSSPLITFINQTPANITTDNLFTQILKFEYNTSIGNITNYYLNYTSNTSWGFLVQTNGTIVTASESYSNDSLVENTSNLFNFSVGETMVYSRIENLPQAQFEANNKTKISLESTQDFISWVFYDKLNESATELLEIMLNTTGTCNVYIYNSSYTTGSPLSSSSVTQIASLNNASYNHCHSGNLSCHQVFNLFYNVTSDTINGIKTTNPMGFMIRGSGPGSCSVYVMNNITRVGTTKLSTNGGTSWTNQTYTVDSHLHVWSNTSQFISQACFMNSTINMNCSAFIYNYLQVSYFQPSQVTFLSPVGGTFYTNETLNITFTNAIVYPYDGVTLRNYSVFLISNVNYSISNNSVSTNYTYNLQNVSNGYYQVRVIANDSRNGTSTTYSDTITITSIRINTINITGKYNSYPDSIDWVSKDASNMSCNVTFTNAINASYDWYNEGIFNKTNATLFGPFVVGSNYTCVASVYNGTFYVNASKSITISQYSEINITIDGLRNQSYELGTPINITAVFNPGNVICIDINDSRYGVNVSCVNGTNNYLFNLTSFMISTDNESRSLFNMTYTSAPQNNTFYLSSHRYDEPLNLSFNVTTNSTLFKIYVNSSLIRTISSDNIYYFNDLTREKQVEPKNTMLTIGYVDVPKTSTVSNFNFTIKGVSKLNTNVTIDETILIVDNGWYSTYDYYYKNYKSSNMTFNIEFCYYYYHNPPGWVCYPFQNNNISVPATCLVNDTIIIRDSRTQNLNFYSDTISCLNSSSELIYLASASYNGQAVFSTISNVTINSDLKDIFIEVGTLDGVREFNQSGMYNITNTTSNLASVINNYTVTCVADSNGVCSVPIYVYSKTSGYLNVSNISLKYTTQYNPININSSYLQSYLNRCSGYCNIPIKIESFTNSTVNISNIKYDYIGGNRNITITAHNPSYSYNSTSIAIIYYSGWNYSFPRYVSYLEFIPGTPTSKNVTPYGQTATKPILNITNQGYANTFNFSINQNETISCVNTTISTSYNKSAGYKLTANTWINLFNNSYGQSKGLWLWSDYNCNSTTWTIWNPDWSFRACCKDCICNTDRS